MFENGLKLFTQPHPARTKTTLQNLHDQENSNSSRSPVSDNIIGLKWGTWCGSPSLADPKLILRKNFKPNNATNVVAFGKSDCAVLPLGWFSFVLLVLVQTSCALTVQVCTGANKTK